MSGEVRYGYQPAAKVGRWEMMPKNEHVMTFKGAAAEVNDYWITQEPLDLMLRVGRTEWTWKGVTVTVADGSVYADLKDKPVVERLST